MPDLNSFADKTRDWRGLLDACAANPDLFINLEPYRVPLTEALDKATSLKAQQEQMAGLRQATTQQLNEVLEQGSEAARRLRRFVAAQLGTKSEQLPQFGVQPRRRRPRRTDAKKKKKETAQPAAPPAPEPGTVAS
jgi:hypothetical protein